MRSRIQPLEMVQQTRFRRWGRYLEIFAAILLLSVVASSTFAAPVLVQHVSKDAGTTLSSSLAFAANNTAGNWIGVLIRAGHSGQVLTVSDTRGNTYHQAVQFNQTLDSPNGETLAIYYAENLAGGANTITVSESLSNNTLRFAILEYSGVAVSSSIDVTAAAQGSGTTLNSGTATTTVGGDLILGLVSAADGQTFTAGSGYVIEERVPAAPNSKLIAEDAVQAAQGAVSVSATLSTTDNGGALLAAFKAASGTLAPNITSLTPNNGPVGTSVTIAGSNFGASQGASTVTFNGVSAGTASIWGTTSITVNVPSGVMSGPVVVTVNGVASNGVLFTVTPQLTMTANAGTTPQSATISIAFANALAVTVKDASSNPVSGVNVTFTAPGSGASGTFSNSTVTIIVATNASGVASASFTANATAGGPYTVTAAASGLTTLNFSLTNTVGTPSTMTANAGATPQSTTISTAFTNALAVTVKDAGSNPVSGVNVTFTAPGSGASGAFSNSTATITVATNASGVASASFTANATAGGPYTVTAAASGLTTLNFSLTNTGGAPSTMTANAGTTPQSATISTAFANALAVTVKDAGSNPVSGVNVTFTAPGSGASGVFSNSTVTIIVATNASGVASASFTANATAGGPYTVTAAATGLTTVNFSLTNTGGAPSTMTANAGTTPQSATISTAFANALAVTVKDASSNPVSGVNVTFTAPASGASGTFSNSTVTIIVATNASGVASASFTANATAGGPYTVTAAATGLTTVNFSLTNTGGAPSTMTANAGTTPQSATISTAFANALAVTVKDASSNPVSGVNVTFTAPASGASGTFSNSTVTIIVATNASGVASASFTANATAGGPYTVTAAASGLTTLNFSLTNLPPATGGINLVQHNSVDAGTTASSSLAFSASNTAGNWIGVVIRAGHSGQVFTVSDTNKNTYKAAVQFNQTLDVPNGDTFAIFYAENIVAGANSVTVSESISGNTLRFAILEYSGVTTFNSLDVTAAAQGGSTSPNSGAATTTVGGDLLLGEIMTGTGTTATAGTGFKLETVVPASPNIKLIVEDQILSTAGSASATATLGASVSWGAALAAFKPPASGGAGPNISGVSPTSAMVSAPVTITGSNFGSSQGSSTVTFNGQSAGIASAWSPTSITVNVPQGALSGNLVVTVGGLQSNAFNFTVNTLTVTVSPIRAGIEISQTQQFTGTVLYDPQNLGVNWYVDTILGGNPTVGTVSSSGFFSPGTQLGVHAVTAISASNSNISATASIAVTNFPGTFTYHNDNSRTGQNLSEYALTPALVNKSTFGKLFSCAIDGAVYAQPLWVPNVLISGVRHNVLLVATAHDSVFAFDADTNPCVTLWQINLIDIPHGGTSSGGVPSETTVPAGSSGNLIGAGAGDISPEVGVVGTPVIDPTTNTLYVVSKSVNPNTLKFFQRLHALDILTGSEKFGGPGSISSAISIPGTGGDSSGGQLQFDEKIENQRPGLALANGIIYVGWGSHEDWGPWHGWLMSFNASSLAFISAFCSTPNGNFGGIWMGGGAPAIDTSNFLYVLTGNGDWDGLTSFGDSILKLDSGLSLASWFTPSDQSYLANNDQDLGSGGAAILIDQPSAPVPHLMIGGGKQGSNQIGELFLLNRDNLGGMTSTDTQPQIVQKFSVGGRIFSTSTFWNNNLYIAGSGTRLQQYTFNPSTEQFTFAQQSSSVYGFPGATAAVSSLVNANGIAWALDNTLYCTPQSPGCGPTVLHAYDATNISTELWNSAQDTTGKDQAGNAVKFTVPTVANGKVYVGTRTEIDIYGLKPN